MYTELVTQTYFSDTSLFRINKICMRDLILLKQANRQIKSYFIFFLSALTFTARTQFFSVALSSGK